MRTEHTFRQAFGPIDDVVERCAVVNAPAAGCVDPNTWGHVRWEKACVERGIQPLFGCELPVDFGPEHASPSAWLLAEDTADLYAFVSLASHPPEAWSSVARCVRFAGAALTDPETFDYIDISPGSALANLRALELHRRTNKPIVITANPWYPAPADRDVFSAMTDNRRMALQHIPTEEELRGALPELDDELWKIARKNTCEVAERLSGFRLHRAPLIDIKDGLKKLARQVADGKRMRLKQGHIAQWTDDYEKRLAREMELIEEKRFQSYFLVVGELVRWAKKRMLVGPGRGSSAGSLVCYLLQITEVDPLVHQLLFERFIDVNRADLPDIDIDFSDRSRDKVFTYLAKKYGADCVARLGNVSTLKPKSVLAECGRRLGIPVHDTFRVRDVLFEYSSGDRRYGAALQDTLEQTQPGKDFAAKYPEAQVMLRAEGHAWHTSVHAAGVIVASLPITRFCSVRDGVCQIDKKSAEDIDLLKIDALGLRTLGVIEDAQCVGADTLYGLKLDDPEVFRIFNDGRFAGVFQFEGAAQRKVAAQIPVTSFEHLDHITALARPGPLGGGAANTYVLRNNGTEQLTYRHPTMAAYLSGTLGVVLYQEQVMRIVKELGHFSWEDTSTIRKAMSGRKGKEFFDRQREMFVKGAAIEGIKETDAVAIWEEICTFGGWGMNRAHTVSYSIISYWCGYMKAYHSLDYAAALLRNAKDDEQVLETLRELRDEGVKYKAFDPKLSREHWAVIDGQLIGGFQNLKNVGPAKASGLVERRNANALTAKDRKLLDEAEIKFDELSPAHATWGHIYDDPDAHNIRGPIREFAELGDRERCVVICKLVRRERRDKNESVYLQKRGGKRHRGQPLFLDAFVVDDSITKPIRLRFQPDHWRKYGEKLADEGRNGEDWLLVRGTWLDQFSMMIADKARCLNRADLF